MEPIYKSGQLVLCMRSKSFRVNDVVAIQTEDFGKVLKRITNISLDGIHVASDNKTYPSPVNSMIHSVKSILGRVIFKISF